MGGRYQFTDDLPCLTSYWVHAKKKTYDYIERDDVKRQAFLEQLATIDPDNIVYADEAGMDNRDDYGYGWNERGKRFHALKSGRRARTRQHDRRLLQSSTDVPFYYCWGL